MSRASTNIIEGELQNYGFVEPQITPDNYVLGGLGSLPKTVLRRDGQWDEFLPAYEPQFGGGWDTFACTVWGTQNCLETLLRLIHEKEYNLEYNFSERFNVILAGVRPPGADPQKVSESIREYGLIPDARLPMTETYEEFLKPDPMETKYLVEGQKFPYEIKHEWLWTIKPSKARRIELIKEALKYSPVGISVTAWFKKNGVYVDNGQPNSHWCECYGWDERGLKVFDSYDQSHKIVSFDHNISVAKRFYLVPRVPSLAAEDRVKLNLMQKLLSLLRIYLWEIIK